MSEGVALLLVMANTIQHYEDYDGDCMVIVASVILLFRLILCAPMRRAVRVSRSAVGVLG